MEWRTLAFAGAVEGRDAEVEEDDYDDGGGDEGAVVGAVGVAEAGAPEGGREDQHRKQEEHAGDLEPDDGASAAEGAEESGEAVGEAAAGAARDSALRAWIAFRWTGLRDGRGIGWGGQALACDAPCNTYSDAKDAAYGLGFHFDMMVTAVPESGAFCRFRRLASCRPAAIAVR